MLTLAALPLGIIPFVDIGAWEWVIIGIIAVVLFGNRLPDLGRSLGKGLVSFRKGISEMKDEISKAATEDLDDISKASSPAKPDKEPVNNTASMNTDQLRCEGKPQAEEPAKEKQGSADTNA